MEVEVWVEVVEVEVEVAVEVRRWKGSGRNSLGYVRTSYAEDRGWEPRRS